MAQIKRRRRARTKSERWPCQLPRHRRLDCWCRPRVPLLHPQLLYSPSPSTLPLRRLSHFQNNAPHIYLTHRFFGGCGRRRGSVNPLRVRLHVRGGVQHPQPPQSSRPRNVTTVQASVPAARRCIPLPPPRFLRLSLASVFARGGWGSREWCGQNRQTAAAAGAAVIGV